jgi:nitric oxide reductase subunit C
MIASMASSPPQESSQAKAPVVVRRTAVIVLGYLAYIVLILVLPGRSPVRAATDAAGGVQASPSSAYMRGQRIWRRNNCQTCHAMYGLGGHTGPDLTTIGSRMPADYIEQVIRTGDRVMPAFDLDEAESADLVAYLQAISRTGVYPPKHWTDPVFGSANPWAGD